MKAGEWLYLCVAHGNENSMEQCCAIDYILHTLDSATALLNSPRAFPSRLQIPATSHRHFSSLARRLGRIFAHAYFHHREAFEQAEAESSLYARFLALSSKFELVPAEFLPIPPEAFSGYENQDIPRDIPPPRLEAADPHPRIQPTPSSQQILHLDVPEKSVSPPGLGVEGSPRKTRNRTDTMVPSDVAAFVEAQNAPVLSLTDEEFPPLSTEPSQSAIEENAKDAQKEEAASAVSESSSGEVADEHDEEDGEEEEEGDEEDESLGKHFTHLMKDTTRICSAESVNPEVDSSLLDAEAVEAQLQVESESKPQSAKDEGSEGKAAPAPSSEKEAEVEVLETKDVTEAASS